jgi:hypothetical protein
MIVRGYFKSASTKFMLPISLTSNECSHILMLLFWMLASPLDLFCIRVPFSFSLLGNVVLLGQLKHIELFLQCFWDDSSQLNIYIRSASHWLLDYRYCLDWKYRVCHTVKKAFVCLSVGNPVLRPHWKLFSVDWEWRFLLRQIKQNLSFSHDWSLSRPFALLLAGRSSAVTHSISMPLVCGEYGSYGIEKQTLISIIRNVEISFSLLNYMASLG